MARSLPAAPPRAARPPAPGSGFKAMIVLAVSLPCSLPEHLVPDATPVSSQRLQAPTGHHPLVFNYAIGHSSSAQCATNSCLQLSAILRKPSPGQPAAASNPHRQPSSRRCPAGSFFGGFPTPASLPGSTLTPGRHPKPFTIADRGGLKRGRQQSTQCGHSA